MTEKSPIPENEKERLNALYELDILSPKTNEVFDKITRLLQAVYNVPIAAFTLIDANRQWFKSKQGLNMAETSRDIAFCAHTICQDDVMVVADASKDPRFSNNPLVTENPYIRFYAGYPIRARKGEKIGSLCIIDSRPRITKTEDLLQLKELAAAIEAELYGHELSAEAQEKINQLIQQKKAPE